MVMLKYPFNIITSGAGKAIAFVKKRAPKRDSFFVDTLRLKRVVDMCYSMGTMGTRVISRVISFWIIC
jgi:hypothetical protein